MKAVCWHGVHDVRVEEVDDPKIVNPHDAIVRVTLTAICGSDLHLYDGYIRRSAAHRRGVGRRSGALRRDKVPFGAAFGKGLTLKMGQTHVQNYTRPLLERIERGEIDPSFVISHRVALDEAPAMYKLFRDKGDSCTKVVMTP